MAQPAYSRNADVNETLREYADLVYKLALSRTRNPADAEDIFQEVFLKYVTAAPTFENEEHKKAWMIRVTINCSKKLFSSAWSRHRASLTELEDEASDSMTLQDESGLLAAIEKLPSSYRTVVHLFYYEDMSVKQISEALKRNESTVKSQLNRARALLREELGGVAYDE